MRTHVFRDNVNIHAPGSDPGARFYSWCWHTHFTGSAKVYTNTLWDVLNKELVLYNAHIHPATHDARIRIKFDTDLDHTQFVLTWG